MSTGEFLELCARNYVDLTYEEFKDACRNLNVLLIGGVENGMKVYTYLSRSSVRLLAKHFGVPLDHN